MGRPSSYTQELADEICLRLVEGESMRAICRDDGMPSQPTIYRWLRENDAFQQQYAHAREDQGHSSADDMRELRAQLMAGELASDVARVAMDTLKWEAAKRVPKVYGDKLDVTSGGDKIDWSARAAAAREGG